MGVVPPFVGVAVNVTLVPAEMLPLGLAAMTTEGVTAVTAVIPLPNTQLEVAPVSAKLVKVPFKPLVALEFVNEVMPALVPAAVPWLNL